MDFHGLQKMTLLDFPGKVACTLFTGGCNFRCPFCHNALLVTDLKNAETIDYDEIISFLRGRIGLLDGVCITGGEPLMNKEILSVAKEIKDLGFKLKIDTNGAFPDLLYEIITQNLADCIAMDIKNSKEKYSQTTGIENFDISPIEKSVELLEKSNTDHEFRTTVTQEFHTEEDFEEIGKWLKGTEKYFLQNFVDSGALIGSGIHPKTPDDMKKCLEKARIYIPNARIRGL